MLYSRSLLFIYFIYNSVLAWRIPGTGEPGGLPSMGSHRVRHDWSDLAAAAAATVCMKARVLKSLHSWKLESRISDQIHLWIDLAEGRRLAVVVYLIPCLGEDRKTRLGMCPGLSEQGRIPKVFSRRAQPCARSILSAHVLISWSVNCQHYFLPRVDKRWVSEGLGCATLHCLGGETQTALKSTETPNVAATVTAASDMTYPGPSMPPLIPSAITQPTKHAQELSCPSSCRLSTWRFQTAAAEVWTSAKNTWQETSTDGPTSSLICL